jgi:signal transduction histidine kinase
MLGDVARLENMVRQIEEYVRFSKSYSFQFEKVDLAPVIEKSRERALAQLADDVVGAVSYEFNAGEEMPQIMADAQALEEVFYNLILNAYEAMPEGGNLVISLKDLQSAISVTVRDTGVGVFNEELTEIFNPFFTSKTSGAGMGLTKVHLLVEEHRGTVSVKSSQGEGTVFEVILPTERLLMGALSTHSVSRGSPSV